MLGRTAAVWVGAVALALGGILLVRYTVDRGLLTEPVRVVLGIALGLVLLVGAERMSAAMHRVAAGMSAAGVAVLLGTFLAASNLYRLISSTTAFVLMGLTVAVAIGLSLRRGMIVAVVGLVGGFLTPMLLATGEPARVTPLFSYLFLIQMALLAVAYRRGWLGLALGSLAAGVLWIVVWAADMSPDGHPTVGLFALAAGAAYAGAAQAPGGAWATPRRRNLLAWCATAFAIVGLTLVALPIEPTPIVWGYWALLGAGCLFLARRDETFWAAPWIAAAVTTLVLWFDVSDGDKPRAGQLLALGFGALYCLMPYVLLAGARRAGVWAALAAVTSAGFFTVALASSPEVARSTWAFVALWIAATYMVLTHGALRRRATLSDGDLVAAVLAATASGFIAAGLGLGLHAEWVGLAWALECAAIAWLAAWLGVPRLRVVLWPLGVLVIVRLVAPDVAAARLDEPLMGTLPLVYLATVAAFAYVARSARTHGEGRLARGYGAAAVGMAMWLALIEVLRWFDVGPYGLTSSLMAMASLALLWMLLGLAVAWLGRRVGEPDLVVVGRAVGALGLAVQLLGPILFSNPILTNEFVGAQRLTNWLVYIYGLPLLVTWLWLNALPLDEAAGVRTWPSAVAALKVALMVQGLVFLTLEVRQWFRGAYLQEGSLSNAENYGYSLTWLLLGLALLALGVRRRSASMRYASLAIMILVVGKVYLADLARMGGLFRVVSFLGLGVSLLGLAYVYQRFVFTDDEGMEDGDGAASVAPVSGEGAANMAPPATGGEAAS